MAGLLTIFVPWLISLFLIFLGIFYLYVKSVYRYFKRRGIPYDQPTFPFGSFTAAVLLRKSMTFSLADIYARHKHQKIVGFFSLWTKQILMRDPNILKNVLIKDFDIFQDRGVYYNKEKDPLSAHMFSIEGNTWKVLRAKLSPTFTSGKLKGMHSNIVDCAKRLLSCIDKYTTPKKGCDCQTVFAKYAQTVVATTAFGLESDSLTDDNSKFAEMTKKMVEPTLERLLTFILMFNRQVATLFNIRVVPKVASEFFQALVRDTIKYREVNNITRNDYLQLLVELKDTMSADSSVSLTEDQLAAQAFVFVVAGSETTAATMSFCLYELSRHPEIQARLNEELDSLPDLSYDSVNGCQYLDMVVSETLRKYPPLGFLNRECSRDYQVPGTEVVIEKGTQVLVSVQGLHNDPDLFPDPETFNPERFSKENKESIRPYTYMPFGDGPRYCIGKRFGLMVVKTGLASVLRRFRIRSPKTTPDTTTPPTPLKIEPRTLITMVTGGLWLVLEERS